MMLRHVLNGLVKRTQHIATGWPNVRNMLCPTMLQDVALKCCERLARPLEVRHWKPPGKKTRARVSSKRTSSNFTLAEIPQDPWYQSIYPS